MTGSDDGAMIAHQSLEQLGGRASILVKQRADHARLDRLMDRARATRAAGGREHAVALRAVARLVFSHAFAEESVLFPAARRVLPEGDPLTLHIEAAHQQVNELVTRLDASSGDASGHIALLERTFAVLHEDVRSEEDELLPRLQQLLSPRQLRALGRRWELVRRIAPTRPHPLVSRRPPGQALSALPLTVLDRGRDRLQWLDEATSGRWSGWLATADRALAAAAGAVERFPLLQRGERKATRQAAGDSGLRDHTDAPQSEVVDGIGQDHPGRDG
jgi:hemerythrin superfamily protein